MALGNGIGDAVAQGNATQGNLFLVSLLFADKRG
jgi:hypothetical protein